MKNELYTLPVDNSNDNELQKMNPLTARIFDVQRGCVTTQLLDIKRALLQIGMEAQQLLSFKRLFKK